MRYTMDLLDAGVFMSEVLKLDEDSKLYEFGITTNNLLQVTSGRPGIVFEVDNLQTWLDKLQSIQEWIGAECLGTPPEQLNQQHNLCEWREHINTFVDGYLHCTRPILNPPPFSPYLRIQGTIDGYEAFISPRDIAHNDFQTIRPPKIVDKSYFDISNAYDEYHTYTAHIETAPDRAGRGGWGYTETLEGRPAGMCVKIPIHCKSSAANSEPCVGGDYSVCICYAAGSDYSASVGGPFDNSGYNHFEGGDAWIENEYTQIYFTFGQGGQGSHPQTAGDRFGIYLKHRATLFTITDTSDNVLMQSRIGGGYVCYYGTGKDSTYAIDHRGSPDVIGNSGWGSNKSVILYLGGFPYVDGEIINVRERHSVGGYVDARTDYNTVMGVGMGPISNFIIQGVGHWSLEERSGGRYYDCGPFKNHGQLENLKIPNRVTGAGIYTDLESTPEAYRMQGESQQEGGNAFYDTVSNFSALIGGTRQGARTLTAQKKFPVITPLYYHAYAETTITGTALYPSGTTASRAPRDAVGLQCAVDIARVLLSGQEQCLISLASSVAGDRRRRLSLVIPQNNPDGESIGSLRVFVKCEYFTVADEAKTMLLGPYTLPYTQATELEVKVSEVVDYKENELGDVVQISGILIRIGQRILDVREILEDVEGFRFVKMSGATPLDRLVVGGVAPFYGEEYSTTSLLNPNNTSKSAVCITDIRIGAGTETQITDNGTSYTTTEYITTRFQGTRSTSELSMEDDDASNTLQLKAKAGSSLEGCWTAAFPAGSTGVAADGASALGWGHSRLGTNNYTGLQFRDSTTQAARALLSPLWFTGSATRVIRYGSGFSGAFEYGEVDRWVRSGLDACAVTDAAIYAIGTDFSDPAYEAWAGAEDRKVCMGIA